MKIQFLIIKLLLIVFFVLYSCKKMPSPVEYNNIYDPIGSFDNNPPHVDFTITPDTGIVKETEFQFNADLCFEHELPNTILYYKWDFDGDGQWDTEFTNHKVAKHIYYSKPQKNINVILCVLGGNNLSSTQLKSLYLNTYPEPSLDWSFDLYDPNKIYFDASSSLDLEDSTSIDIRWDFNNDGIWDTNWSSNKKIAYTFSNLTKWYIQLEARDKLYLTKLKKFNHSILDTNMFIAAYNFHKNSSSTISNSYDYSVHNAILTEDRFNNENSAYFFNGNNSYISIPKIKNIMEDGGITISFWIKLKNLETPLLQYCLEINQNNYTGHLQSKTPGYIHFKNHRGHYCNSYDVLKPNKWYHITGVIYKHTDYPDIYINGHPNNFSGGHNYEKFVYYTDSLEIGRVANDYSHSTIDDVIIYKRALNEEEIENLYHIKPL